MVFPFLQLATETRLQIYRLLLPYSEYSKEGEETDSPVEWIPGQCPCILFVNRKIHLEAAEILYGANVFSIYVRHPRAPRLPMNESRADASSFVLISWKGRTWFNPRNPKLSPSILTNRNLRRLHVSLPPLNDLLGIDVYMQKSSYASFNGINAWIRKCIKADGVIDDQEKERMTYVQNTKSAIDVIGESIRCLPRIDMLYLSLQAREREPSFAVYLLQALLNLTNVSNASCFYAFGQTKGRPIVQGLENTDHTLLRSLETKLVESSNQKDEAHLPKDMEEMYFLLQSIRAKQQLDLDALPDWLHTMPS